MNAHREHVCARAHLCRTSSPLGRSPPRRRYPAQIATTTQSPGQKARVSDHKQPLRSCVCNPSPETPTSSSPLLAPLTTPPPRMQEAGGSRPVLPHYRPLRRHSAAQRRPFLRFAVPPAGFAQRIKEARAGAPPAPVRGMSPLLEYRYAPRNRSVPGPRRRPRTQDAWPVPTARPPGCDASGVARCPHGGRTNGGDELTHEYYALQPRCCCMRGWAAASESD